MSASASDNNAGESPRVALHRLPIGAATAPDRTLLFAHAGGYCGQVWIAVSTAIRSSWSRSALDFRGHGRSAPLPPTAGWDAFGADVRHAAATVGGVLVGVGHSLGATALLLAEAAAPGTFEALVCFEPILATVDDPRFAAAAARRPDRFLSASAALEQLSKTPPWSRLAPSVRADYVRYAFMEEPAGGVRLRCRPEVEAQVYRTAISCQWREALHLVGCEVLVLRGAGSAVVSDEAAATAARLIPRCRTRTVSSMDHLGPLCDPDRFADVLNAELDAL